MTEQSRNVRFESFGWLGFHHVALVPGNFPTRQALFCETW